MGDAHETGGEESGVWLSLRDAVAELSMAEGQINQLVSDGKLRSRDHTDGNVEIWLPEERQTDRSHRLSETVTVDDTDRSMLLVDHVSTAVNHQVQVLTAPLAASYEQNVKLARENGMLTERVFALERELQTLRERANSEDRTVEQMRKRLEAVEGANTALTRMLKARMDEQSQREHIPWIVPTAALVIVAAVAAGLAAWWYAGHLF